MTIPSGGTAEADIVYDTNPREPNLAGLGLRIHYDSSAIVPADPPFSSPFLKGVQGFNPSLPDTQDFDNDSSTDRFAEIEWQRTQEDWPGGNLPRRLVVLRFVTNENFVGTTSVNFTAFNQPDGWGFSSTTGVITVTPPPTTTTTTTTTTSTSSTSSTSSSSTSSTSSTSTTTTTLLSYDVWISSNQSGSPFTPFHDCVRFNNSVMSTDVCGDSGTVARVPILDITGLELWIGHVPCQGLDLAYIGTAFAGEALPLGGNTLAASIIGLTLVNSLGLEGFENAGCTTAISSNNPYAAGVQVPRHNRGPGVRGLFSQGDPQAPLGPMGEAQTVGNTTFEVWMSQGSDAPPFVPGRDCVRFTAFTIASDACGDRGPFVESTLLSTPGLTFWVGQVPCQGANLVYFGTSFNGTGLPFGGNVMSASVVGLSQGSTLALEGFENPSCSIVP